MEGAGVDWARATQCPQEFWVGCVPVDLDEGGDLASSVSGGDLECVPDTGVLEVDAPPRPRMDIRLWASWGWGTLSFFLGLDCCLDRSFGVKLNQCVHREVKEGRGSRGERGQRGRMGRRGEGRYGVSWGHRFTVGADDIVREMGEGRRNGKRGSEGLGLYFPVFVQLVVLVDGRSAFRDGRRRNVEESGEGDGWGRGECGQNFGDGGGEHSAPMSNHRPMPCGDAKP